MLFFYYYCLLTLPAAQCTTYSLSFLGRFLRRYTNTNTFFFLLILSMSGLPPVLLFFIKINFFLTFFSAISFFLQICLFIFFFFTMLYYLQIFNILNTREPLAISELQLFTQKLFSSNYLAFYYQFFFLFMCYLGIIFLSFFFFSDFFLILSAFF